MGAIMLKHEELLKNPDKAAEFQQEMEIIIKNEQIFDWVETLETPKIKAIMQMLKMEEEKRYEQRKFR